MRLRWGAVLLVALVSATSIHAQERGLGAYYIKKLRGDFPLVPFIPGISRPGLPPGTIDIEKELIGLMDAGELSEDFGTKPKSVVRLPNGHYLFGGEGGRVIEMNVNSFFQWKVLSTSATPIVQPMIEMPGTLTWDRSLGPDSRVWLGVGPGAISLYGPNIRSYDWRKDRFDEPLMNSSFGLKELESVDVPVRESAFGVVAEIGNRKVWVTSDLSSLNFNQMGGSTEVLPMSQPPVQLSPMLPDTLRCAPVYDPIDGTIWMGAMGQKFQPFRMVEHDLSGEATGRIYQPEVPFLPVNTENTDALGADFYIDRDGNRVLAFFVTRVEKRDPFGGLFGGFGIPPPRYVLVEVRADFTYGAGCSGELSYLGDPSIASTWEVTLSDADPSSLNFAFLWRGTPEADWLPIVPGITSCNLHLDMSSRFGVLGVAPLFDGQASMNLPIPDEPFLIGVPLGFQWLIAGDSSHLPLGLSSAGAVRIGSK